MKTMGVIGGIGPQATMDFEARVHKFSQQLLPHRFNSGYPPMVVCYHRRPPMNTDEQGRPLQPPQLDTDLVEKLFHLGKMVDFIVITSNSPHVFRASIEEAAGRPVLSMIDLTVEEVQRLGWRRVGLLGFGRPVVYQVEFDRLGIPYETLPDESGGLRDKLDGAIADYMAGDATPESRSLAFEAVEYVRSKQVDGVVLGCTEIPLLMGEEAQTPDLLNPLQLLAEASVRFALQ